MVEKGSSLDFRENCAQKYYGLLLSLRGHSSWVQGLSTLRFLSSQIPGGLHGCSGSSTRVGARGV